MYCVKQRLSLFDERASITHLKQPTDVSFDDGTIFCFQPRSLLSSARCLVGRGKYFITERQPRCEVSSSVYRFKAA
jgi:hypothetical protein